MSVEEKLAILRAVECSPMPVTEALARLDVPISTYYRWRDESSALSAGEACRIFRHIKTGCGINCYRKNVIIS